MTAPLKKGFPASAKDASVVDVAPATALAVRNAAAHSTVRALAQQLRYEGATDPDTLENSAREAIRRIGMSVFELGGYLLLLREASPYGTFMPALERVGIGERAARQYMAVTRRFANRQANAVLESAGFTKMAELVTLEDEQIDELLLTGQTGELALDDVATMSVKELRAAVREAKAERAAQEDLLATKNKQIDALKLKTKRIAAAPPDEALAELKKEATGIANDAQGCILGGLRAALQAITDHAAAQDQVGAHDVFMAGLVAQVQATLSQVRDQFMLRDLAAAALAQPDWMRPEWQDPADAANAANKG